MGNHLKVIADYEIVDDRAKESSFSLSHFLTFSFSRSDFTHGMQWLAWGGWIVR